MRKNTTKAPVQPENGVAQALPPNHEAGASLQAFPGGSLGTRKRGRNYAGARFCVLFLVYLALFYMAGTTSHFGNKVEEHLYIPLKEKIALASSWTLNLAQLKTHIDPENKTVVLNDQFGVTIQNGCAGIYISMLIIAALLAYPLSLSARIFGILAGILVAQCINLFRVIWLFLMGQYWPGLFHESHVFFAPLIVMACTMAFWLFWINRFAPSPCMDPQGFDFERAEK